MEQSSGQPEAPEGGQQPESQYGYYPYPPRPVQPTNGYALASIITSSVSLAVLFFSAGILAPLTGIASVIGAILGHKGMDDVDKGRAVQQRDMAVAGMWVGISGIVLSVLALIVWVGLLVLAVAFDDSNSGLEFHREFNWD